MKLAENHCPDFQSRYPSGRKIVKQVAAFLAIACAIGLASARTYAQDEINVSSCPGQPKIPVTLQIDCSHVSAAADKQLCRPFIQNQACKVFPAYRKITGIKLEQTCPAIKFTIYDDANWPHPKGEGGLALHCAVDYLTEYSIKFRSNSKLGPYDVHELLHEYQIALGPLPSAHVLFGPSMAEAMREVDDVEGYQQRVKSMQDEAQRLKEKLDGEKANRPRMTACLPRPR
ncbi:MAG TPA: hypothetical protein VK699_16145 [Terriglobales bacterium]|jgi:hypothetical protein|nr:hypothetical protein [Terriglobales bacterium]